MDSLATAEVRTRSLFEGVSVGQNLETGLYSGKCGDIVK